MSVFQSWRKLNSLLVLPGEKRGNGSEREYIRQAHRHYEEILLYVVDL